MSNSGKQLVSVTVRVDPEVLKEVELGALESGQSRSHVAGSWLSFFALEIVRPKRIEAGVTEAAIRRRADQRAAHPNPWEFAGESDEQAEGQPVAEPSKTRSR